jgi:GTP-binding protein
MRWRHNIDAYFRKRSPRALKCVFVLVDARYGMKQLDFDFCDYLQSLRRRFRVVLTKTDAVSPRQLVRVATKTRNDTKERYSKCAVQPTLMVSARTSGGVAEILACMGQYAIRTSR